MVTCTTEWDYGLFWEVNPSMELIMQIAVGVLIGMVLFALARVAFWAFVRLIEEHPVGALVLGIFLVLLGWVAYMELFHPDQRGVLR
jgi:hypothetical protein